MSLDQDWITSPTVRRVLTHWADIRPAWLWSGDGTQLIWRNEAGAAFAARARRSAGADRAEAVPIRGQIARLMRLGAVGRTSLSRVQFLAAERPLATTCHCTPLLLGERAVLLIVGVDPVAADLSNAVQNFSDKLPLALFPEEAEFLLVNEDGQIASGSPGAVSDFAPQIESEGLPPLGDGETGVFVFDGHKVALSRFRASPQDAILLLFQRQADVPDAGAPSPELNPAVPVAISDPGPAADAGATGGQESPHIASEAELDASLPEPVATELAPRPSDGPAQSLSELFDALMQDEKLYLPLGPSDESFAGEVAVPASADLAGSAPDPEPAAIAQLREDEGIDPEPHHPAPDPIGLLIAEATAQQPHDEVPLTGASRVVDAGALPEAESPPPAAAVADATGEVMPRETAAQAEIHPGDGAGSEQDAEAGTPAEPLHEVVTQWRITGRGFKPIVLAPNVPLPQDKAIGAAEDEAPAPVAGLSADDHADAETGLPDRETVERVSRYNFDELGRILADRVANGRSEEPAPAGPPPVAAESSLISLPGETLVLNRLPLGILIFRDQQVLFANRAMTELLGHESIESLRRAGLDSVFPAELVAGPVTRLVSADGATLPVNARLQSISWNGKPALMLSAATMEARLGHEAAVRTFAELAADTAEDGFLMADRAGLIVLVSLHGKVLLGRPDSELEGRAIAGLIEPERLPDLRGFLERPARFAETARPAIVLPLAGAPLDLILFAEGQAGIIAGYFGFLRRRGHRAAEAEAETASGTEIEPSILARISRGLRGPLNTVIGFADMIRLGSGETGRVPEYAGDIKSAGEEMAVLVGELDDYTRLSEGRYPLSPDEIDLAALLESCLVRVRGQAGDARVLVRSAVSEHLPHISADRASLTQAVLNLLASAIDQTPPGGSVILSAQREESGAVVVNVRDSGDPRRDLGERFVVFRDGLGRDGEALAPVRSSVGLALTRSLLAVNALKLTVDPAAAGGTLFSLTVPPDLVRAG